MGERVGERGGRERVGGGDWEEDDWEGGGGFG